MGTEVINPNANSRKLKVVWICHFSNSEIRNLVPLSEKKLLTLLKGIAGKNASKIGYYDFAPWITNLIKEFVRFENIELHIIAPMAGMKKLFIDFVHDNVHYYFFKPDLPILHANISKKIVKHPKYRWNRFYIKRKILSLKPDIINLIGAENPYYSSAILSITNFPVFVSCQTIYSNPDREKMGDKLNPHRKKIELKIHKKESYFGCTGRLHRDLLLLNNPNAIVFKMFFPFEKSTIGGGSVKKKYDFVFYAGLAKKKGVEDLIQAFRILKTKHGNSTLNIIGKTSPSYIFYLKGLILKYGMQENIIFNDYFDSHAELHNHLLCSRFAVLPLKLDVISSAIKEAMHLGLPVITYKTSGTPYLNRDGQAVLIAEMNNIDQLAQYMITLLESPELANTLRENAKAFVEKEFDNTVSAQRLVKNYHAVINHYHHNEPIPEELLFNPQEFPLY